MDGSEVQQHLFLPIVRFDEANWTVTGQATVEDEDAYGTVFDYEASKRAFNAWRGNVREMHDSKKAVGRALDVSYDDATKSIFVTTRVSRGAKDTWEKIKDGTLQGYSVGALASKDDWGTVERAGKSVPLLKNYKMVELSLVDHPATPGCDIAIVRADGFANGEVVAEDEPEQVEAVAEPTDARAGQKISHVTQDTLHGLRNSALNQARSTMQLCAGDGCTDCQAGLDALDPDNDGDIDLIPSMDYDHDGGQNDMMAGYRQLEPMIQRAMAPTIQRASGILAGIIANTQSHTPVPVNVDLQPIERRLEVIEQNAKAVADIEALTRALDAKLVEIKEITERIANQPVGGGPIQNVAAMDKVLATQTGMRNPANDVAAILRASQAGAFQTQEQQVGAAAELIRLQRGM